MRDVHNRPGRTSIGSETAGVAHDRGRDSARLDVRTISRGQRSQMASAARVADQDTDNLKRIQRRLRASKKPGVTLAAYQESRIRHFHETLDRYMFPEGATASA